ncbi:hypothetical protein [Campylobacter lanienae]|uniref:hypothetical protein n=1 Tax=Campylobacter lanienae TaxID=75658 RepID=UPI000BB3EDF9|nr:hypothetical protein [Campylobacter lanienae]
MQNINYLDITSKLPKLGAKKLYFSLDISAYDGVRLLILQKLFLIDGLRKRYLKDRDIALLIKINSYFLQINTLINSFDFIFDKLIVAKFNKLLGEILPLLGSIESFKKDKNHKFKELLNDIERYFDSGFESFCFELEIFLYDTHSFYCASNSLISHSASYAIRKKIVNLRQNIRAKSALKSNLLQELSMLTNIFLELFKLDKFDSKLSKITNLYIKYKNINEKNIKKNLKKELNKKLKKFDKKLSNQSKKLKSHYQKDN